MTGSVSSLTKIPVISGTERMPKYAISPASLSASLSMLVKAKRFSVCVVCPSVIFTIGAGGCQSVQSTYATCPPALIGDATGPK